MRILARILLLLELGKDYPTSEKIRKAFEVCWWTDLFFPSVQLLYILIFLKSTVVNKIRLIKKYICFWIILYFDSRRTPAVIFIKKRSLRISGCNKYNGNSKQFCVSLSILFLHNSLYNFTSSLHLRINEMLCCLICS